VLEQQLSFKQGSLSSFKTKKLYNIGVFLDNELVESFCDIESETNNDESQLLHSATKEESSSDMNHSAENPEWSSMFAKLEAFKESRGHVTVLLVRSNVQCFPYNSLYRFLHPLQSDDVELHHWLQEQQRLYHKCILNVSHFEQLDQMGVDWSYSPQQKTSQDPLSVSSSVLSDSIWDAKFKELTSFYEAHGHMYPPKVSSFEGVETITY
jgi:Helicase associated domain